MKTFQAALLALAVTAALAGCNAGRDTATETSAKIENGVESNMQTAFEKARRELATENISLNAAGAPKAEITPKGDLLIAGKAVPVTAEQRSLLLEYRMHVSAIASAGMDVGMQGARLATRAMGEAVRGVFSGDGDKVEKRIEAQAEPIRQAALKLCDQLPGMYRTQQALKASLPAFAPYATMDANDFDECRRDAADGQAPAEPNASGAGLTASDAIGKPELPKLPELPDPTG